MRKLFFIPFLFCFFTLSAQNWMPGFVLLNETDTLWGEINFRIPRQNQEQAEFRVNANDPVQTFAPSEIFGYRIYPDGKFFVSRTIEINGEERLSFVEFLVQGMLDLFYYFDFESRQSFFFFAGDDRETLSLTRQIIDVNWDDSSTFVRRNERVYRRIDNQFDTWIRSYFYQHPEIAQHPQRFEFNQATMIEIARTYHELTCPIGSECIVFENLRPDRTDINVRISPYVSLENYIFTYGISNGNVFVPSLGATFYFVYPQLSNNFGLFLDFSISRINSMVNDIEYGMRWVVYNVYRDIDFEVFPVTGRVGLKYFRTMGRFTPTAKAGFSFRYFLGNISVEDYAVFGNVRHPEREFDNPIRNFPGIHAAIGSEYSLQNGGALSLFVTFDHSAKRQFHNRPPILSDALTTFGLRIGYIF